MIIDAKGLIVGRLASFAAEKALAGEQVDIVNCDFAIITGNPNNAVALAKKKLKLGVVGQGPYFPKKPAGIMRRAVRGMLPFKRARGRAAYSRVKCYEGFPEEFKGKEIITLKELHSDKKHITLARLCKLVSGG